MHHAPFQPSCPQQAAVSGVEPNVGPTLRLPVTPSEQECGVCSDDKTVPHWSAPPLGALCLIEQCHCGALALYSSPSKGRRVGRRGTEWAQSVEWMAAGWAQAGPGSTAVHTRGLVLLQGPRACASRIKEKTKWEQKRRAGKNDIAGNGRGRREVGLRC